jgi:hypothetical protein
MVAIIRVLIISLLAASIMPLAGCTNTPAIAVPSTTNAPSQTAAQPAVQLPAEKPAAQAGQPTGPNDLKQGNANVATADQTAVKTGVLLSTRVDVIYFHVNQRCVTCLCFEEHVNNVIEKYFADDITSGKLTYKVLNAQLPQNIAIAKKYGAVGSQLFVNAVVNGFDNIEDIGDIWNWNCRNNPAGFELKVKNIIEQSLKGQR